MNARLLALFLLVAPASADALSITYLADNRSMWARYTDGIEPLYERAAPPVPFGDWSGSVVAPGSAAAASLTSSMGPRSMEATLHTETHCRCAPTEDWWPAAQSIFSVRIMLDEPATFRVVAPLETSFAIWDVDASRLILGSPSGGYDTLVPLDAGVEYNVGAFSLSHAGGLNAAAFSMTHVPEPGSLALVTLGLAATGAVTRAARKATECGPTQPRDRWRPGRHSNSRPARKS